MRRFFDPFGIIFCFVLLFFGLLAGFFVYNASAATLSTSIFPTLYAGAPLTDTVTVNNGYCWQGAQEFMAAYYNTDDIWGYTSGLNMMIIKMGSTEQAKKAIEDCFVISRQDDDLLKFPIIREPVQNLTVAGYPAYLEKTSVPVDERFGASLDTVVGSYIISIGAGTANNEPVSVEFLKEAAGLLISNLPAEAKKENGEVCGSNNQCVSNFCLSGICRPADYEYCGNNKCGTGEDCNLCEKDCGKCLIKDGGACTSNGSCESQFCLWDCAPGKSCSKTGTCRPQGYTWCGDNKCQPNEDCSCQDCVKEARCVKPKFELSLISPNKPKAGETKSVIIRIKNIGTDKLTRVKIEMIQNNPSRASFAYSLCQDQIKCSLITDDIAPGETRDLPLEKTGLEFRKPGTADVDVRATVYNSAETLSETISQNIRIEAPAVKLSLQTTPSSIVSQTGNMDLVRLALQVFGDEQVERKNVSIKVKAEDSSIVDIRSAEGLFAGRISYNYPRLASFYVDPKKVGYTNLTISVEGDNIEPLYKTISMQALARPAVLDVNAPGGLIIKKGEDREITLNIKNRGIGLAYEPIIEVENQAGLWMEGQSNPIYLDSIPSNGQKVQKINLHASETGKYDFKIKIKYADEPADKFEAPNYAYSREIYIDALVEDEKKVCQDNACEEQVQCLVELSNIMQCGLEVADIFPYLDKPIAAVLATSDFCEILERAENKDPIGASVTSFLATVDIGDNGADAVPGAGNAASVVIDTIEGAADCLEGFVYDGVDTYCAAGNTYGLGGYTGCFDNLATATANVASQAYGSVGAASSMFFGMFGSPVSFQIVDNSGTELGLADGVAIVEQGDLKMFLIKNPEKLTSGYNIKLTGTDNGTYSLHTALIDKGKVQATNILTNQSVQRAESEDIDLSVKEKDGKISSFVVAGRETKIKSNKLIFVLAGSVVVVVVITTSGYILYRHSRKHRL